MTKMKLNISLNQAIEQLEKLTFKIMSKDKLDNNKERIIMQDIYEHSVKYGIIELIYNNQEIYKATITTIIPKNNEYGIKMIDMYLRGFLLIMVPGFNQSGSWLNNQLKYLAKHPTKKCMRIEKNNEITLSLLTDLGSIFLTVEAKND